MVDRHRWTKVAFKVAIASRFDITTLIAETTLVPSSVWVYVMHSTDSKGKRTHHYIVQY